VSSRFGIQHSRAHFLLGAQCAHCMLSAPSENAADVSSSTPPSSCSAVEVEGGRHSRVPLAVVAGVCRGWLAATVLHCIRSIKQHQASSSAKQRPSFSLTVCLQCLHCSRSLFFSFLFLQNKGWFIAVGRPHRPALTCLSAFCLRLRSKSSYPAVARSWSAVMGLLANSSSHSCVQHDSSDGGTLDTLRATGHGGTR